METDEELEPETQMAEGSSAVHDANSTALPSTSGASKANSFEEEKYFSVEEESSNLPQTLGNPALVAGSSNNAEKTREMESESVANIPSGSSMAVANIEEHTENHPALTVKMPLSSNIDSNGKSQMESESSVTVPFESRVTAPEVERISGNLSVATELVVNVANASFAQSEVKAKITVENGVGTTVLEETSGPNMQNDGDTSLVSNTSLGTTYYQKIKFLFFSNKEHF
jgi:hypothetical protein